MIQPPSVWPSQLPGSLPPDVLPDGDHVSSSTAFLQAALQQPKTEHFTPDALWRDWMVFSDRVRTRAGAEVISGVWTQLCAMAKPHDFQFDAPMAMRMIPGSSWAEATFNFKSTCEGYPAHCSGRVSLLPHKGSWQIFELVTLLEGVDGKHSPDVYDAGHAFKGTVSGGARGSSNGASNGDQPERGGGSHFEVLIVGGGQGGLSAAARLSATGISNIVIEKTNQLGDAWANKYDSFHFHTIKEMNTLPFDKTFPDDAPEFTSGKIARECYEKYADKYHLNVRLGTTVTSATRNADEKMWHVKTVSADAVVTQYTAKHLVDCSGHLEAKIRYPDFPGMDRFKGKLMHASQWKNADGLEGKRGVIIGSSTNAHDICDDMFKAGLSSITMVQRGKTPVIPLECTGASTFKMGIPIDALDRMQARPVKHFVQMSDSFMTAYIAGNPQRLRDIAKTGFLNDLDMFMAERMVTTAGGYYIDVGTTQHIIDGHIRVKSDSAISHFTEGGLAFADGTELPADAVVCATGFDNEKRASIERIVGPDVAAHCGPWWGLDSEGEFRGLLVQECRFTYS